MKKLFMVSILLITGLGLSNAQSSVEVDKFDQYFEQLNLDELQKDVFQKIILKYDTALADLMKGGKSPQVQAEIDNLLKNEISEIYHALPKAQFRTYKRLRKIIEPHKTINHQ